MKHTPKVTVVITCYNYAEYVGEAIESVLAQTYENIDLIVIDDGSSDNSLEKIEKYKEVSRVKIISRENKGVIYTRNEALDLVKSGFICFLDADDYIDSKYIELLVGTAVKGDLDIVYTDWKMFGAQSGISNFPQYDLEKLKNFNYIHISCLMNRSSIGSYRFDENLANHSHEDWEFFLNLCSDDKKVVKCEGTYLHYRMHESSRNNKVLSDEYRRKYIDTYAYIIDKQIRQNPSQYDYLIGRTIAHWYADSDNKKNDAMNKVMLVEGKNLELEALVSNIYNSREYRVGNWLVHPKRTIRSIKNFIRREFHDKITFYKNKVHKPSDYFIEIRRDDNAKKSDNAVVIHLYYTENWPLFRKMLRNIPKDDYDLFITLPEKNKHFIESIKESHPGVSVFIVPNRGRDVLPFLMVMNTIEEERYKNVLKLHSKKSTHRDDGQQWLEDMLSKLLPDRQTVEQILKTLGNSSTGIIGPEGLYYPLTINFPANGVGMKRILRLLYSPFYKPEKIKEKYGFYGGTMIWMRVDAIKKLLYFSPSFFERENGQIDGTFAHAIERMLCVVPQLENRDMYDVSKGSVEKRNYTSLNIPEWSRDHDK